MALLHLCGMNERVLTTPPATGGASGYIFAMLRWLIAHDGTPDGGRCGPRRELTPPHYGLRCPCTL